MTFDASLYARALDLAARAHHGQQVPGTDLPYLVHVVKVAAETLASCGAEGLSSSDTELAMTAALLHDTVEDTTVTLEALALQFGPTVAAAVAALTKDDTLPKAERMADSLARLGLQPPAVQRVKLADRCVNLEPPPAAWSGEKCRGYLREAERIVAALGAASPYLVARMRERMVAYERIVVERGG